MKLFLHREFSTALEVVPGPRQQVVTIEIWYYSLSHSNEFISGGSKVVAAFDGIKHAADVG